MPSVLQELQPQLAVALLALPLDAPDAGPQRARGLAVAESVLRAAAGSSGSVRAAGHTAFVQQLVGCLTATEQASAGLLAGLLPSSVAPQLVPHFISPLVCLGQLIGRFWSLYHT